MAPPLSQKPLALGRIVSRRLTGISDRVLTPSKDAARYAELHLPAPPKDDQVYRFFDTAFWRFVWILVTQLAILFGFIMVMRHSVYTTVFGLVCLAFMIPHLVDSAYLRLRRRSISLDAHLALKRAFVETAEHDASVDVFLPVCGEEIAVLQNTFHYVRKLDWPGRLTVYVLDDADSAEVATLAAYYEFEYVVRENRGWMKKAGNLINAFDHSTSAFIAVFDADFAPRSDFLWETLPYMEDRRVGVVQTSQFFNVDKRYNFVSRSAGALQEFFFRWVQCQRQLDDAAIVAGTNLVYRRAAVAAAGGFAQTPIGEDVHSGIKLWWAGYKTRYVPLALATGLAPESFNALANQQYRWCRSSMLLMINTHFRDAALTRKQRLCFWAAFLFYMTSALIPITASTTGLLMIWLYPSKVHPINYLPLLPGAVSTCLIFRTLAKGWWLGIYRVCMINSFCHMLACVHALRGHVEPWAPTGDKTIKANTPRTVARMFRTWFVIVQALIWTGIARDLQTHPIIPFLPVISLACLQLYLLFPSVMRLPYNHVFDRRIVWPHHPDRGLFMQPDDLVVLADA